MKNISPGWKYFLIIAAIGVLTFLVVGFNSRMTELRRLSAQKERVAAEYDELKHTELNLDAAIAYATSDEAVEEWAYEDAHKKQAGDNLIVLLPSEVSTPEPVLMLEDVQSDVKNWQVWVALFFDERESP